MRFSEFSIRLGDVRLLDLSDGHEIVERLNEATDDPHFKVEMTGKDLISVYESLPAMLKKSVDSCKIMDDNKWLDVIEDIERGLIHLNDMRQKDEQIVEATLKTYSFITLFIVLILTIIFRTYSAPMLDGQDVRADRIVTEVIKVLYSDIDSVK